MEKFAMLTAVAAPFPGSNIDTDFIIRIERCTGAPREEVGRYAFEMARFLPGGIVGPLLAPLRTRKAAQRATGPAIEA